jgi:hypothetical protein
MMVIIVAVVSDSDILSMCAKSYRSHESCKSVEINQTTRLFAEKQFVTFISVFVCFSVVDKRKTFDRYPESTQCGPSRRARRSSVILSLASYESQVMMEIIFFYIVVVLLTTALIWLILVGSRLKVA